MEGTHSLVLKPPFTNHFLVRFNEEVLSLQTKIALEQSQAYLVLLEGKEARYEGDYILFVYGKKPEEVPAYLEKQKVLKSYKTIPGNEPIELGHSI